MPAWENPYSIQGGVIAEQIVPRIRAVAEKNGLKVIDLHSAMDDKALFQEDMVHPNYRGVARMASIIAEEIK